jgi:pyrimidine operon attenuation protein/uracil phosphoribosyltransferase
VPTVVLDAPAIEKAIAAMASTLAVRRSDAPWAVVGIRRGGEPLAKRLAVHLERLTGHRPPVGSVDITLYRDDGFGPHDWPTVGTSRIGFDIPQHTIVLVDDVLYTGRTVRAALDAILDYGRPKAVRLAVLVDRGLRELPIAGDAVGKIVETKQSEHVTVRLSDRASPEDQAFIEPKPSTSRPEPSEKADKKRGKGSLP